MGAYGRRDGGLQAGVADFIRLLRVNGKRRAILRAGHRGRRRALQAIEAQRAGKPQRFD